MVKHFRLHGFCQTNRSVAKRANIVWPNIVQTLFAAALPRKINVNGSLIPFLIDCLFLLEQALLAKVAKFVRLAKCWVKMFDLDQFWNTIQMQS